MIGKALGIVFALAMLAAVAPHDHAVAQATPPAALACGAKPAAATATSTRPPASGAVGSPLASPAARSPLRPVADIPLPGGASRFDYQSLDPTTGRLYIAHMGTDQIVAFDTRSQQVIGTVDDVKTPTGTLVVPELDWVFAAETGRHDVAVIDARSLRVIARTGTIGFPDGLAYAPQAKRVFVSDESGGGELVVDAATDKAVTTIDIGGEAGNTQYDAGSGCIVVAVQNRDQLVAIDPATDRIAGRFDLDADCRTPHGVLIDAPARMAYVACEDNAKLVAVDLRAMRVIGANAVGDSPDVLAFDPGWRVLYVASESGVVAVFDARQPNLRPLGDYRAPHAHTIAVDPASHLVYLPLENVAGNPVLRILSPRRPPPPEDGVAQLG
jgi:DNA-binding beta-propeller fold protein YncE